MVKAIVWILVIAGLYFAYQAGWFSNITNYFEQAGQERVIEEADGSTTTIKYKNIFDLLMGK